MAITFNNYHIKTEVVFKGCKIPKRKPDFTSDSGSKYWQGIDKNGAYIIRASDHWVNIKNIGKNDIKNDCKKIATCQWHLKTTDSNHFRAGKAYLTSFKTAIRCTGRKQRELKSRSWRRYDLQRQTPQPLSGIP